MKINVPDFKKKVTISYQSLSIIPEGNTIIFHFPLSTFNSSPCCVKSTSMLFFYCVQCQRVLGLIQLGVDAAVSSSSPWVPHSVITPSAMDTMRLALRMVLRR